MNWTKYWHFKNSLIMHSCLLTAVFAACQVNIIPASPRSQSLSCWFSEQRVSLQERIHFPFIFTCCNSIRGNVQTWAMAFGQMQKGFKRGEMWGTIWYAWDCIGSIKELRWVEVVPVHCSCTWKKKCSLKILQSSLANTEIEALFCYAYNVYFIFCPFPLYFHL